MRVDKSPIKNDQKKKKIKKKIKYLHLKCKNVILYKWYTRKTVKEYINIMRKPMLFLLSAIEHRENQQQQQNVCCTSNFSLFFS